MLNESDAVNRSTANGATTVFPYTFKILDESEIEVLANETVLTLDTDYAVSGVGVDGGGNITTVATYANGTIITRLRKQPTTQTSNYQSETFPPERIERDFDKLAMRLQQVKEHLRRCLSFSKSSSTVDQSVDAPVAGSFARAKVGGGIDWANVVSAGTISTPVAVAEGGTGVTTATGTGSVVRQDNPTINNPTIASLALSAVTDISMVGGINEAISTVASSATPDIFAITVGNTVNYTGATPATGFVASPQAGAQRLLVCAAAAPFVAGANMLIDGIASGGTFTAATGDKILVVAVTTTQFRLTPMKADGTAVSNPLSSLTSIQNPIINGTMEVWQRGTTFAAAADGQFAADRFHWKQVGAGVVTLRQSTTVPSVAQAGVLLNYSLEVDVTTADAAIGAADTYSVRHKIEGGNWRHFAQREITVSFWVSSTKTGVHSFAIRNSGTDRYYIAEYTVDVADTPEHKTITIGSSPAAGTWNYTTGIGAELIWTLAAGSNFHGTVGAWTAGALYASASQVNGLDSNSNFFRITGVKMEIGGSATALQYIPFVAEYEQCKRYYQKSFAYDVAPVQNVGSAASCEIWYSPYTATTANAFVVPLKPAMIDAPSVTTYNPFAANAHPRNASDAADDAISTLVSNARQLILNFGPNAANTAGDFHYLHWTADDEL